MQTKLINNKQSENTNEKKSTQNSNTAKHHYTKKNNVRTTDLKKMINICLTEPNSVTNEEFLLLQKAIGYQQTVDLLQNGKQRTAQAKGGQSGTKTYVVKSGDNLSEIAEKFNTTVAELVKLNNIADKNTIYPGQILKLPSAASPKTVPSKPKTTVSNSTGTVKKNSATGKSDVKDPLYKYEAELINKVSSINTKKFSWDLSHIQKVYDSNKSTYEAISKKTDFPPELICAIHYRESGCNFNTYLHNGQPLGKPTTIVPAGRLFTDFKLAAVDALMSFKSLRDKYGITSNCHDMAALIGFAESYNGLGYKNHHNTPSPYVYSGTNVYKSGKYVSDGKYSSKAVDGQPGVYILVDELMGDASSSTANKEKTPAKSKKVSTPSASKTYVVKSGDASKKTQIAKSGSEKNGIVNAEKLTDNVNKYVNFIFTDAKGNKSKKLQIYYEWGGKMSLEQLNKKLIDLGLKADDPKLQAKVTEYAKDEKITLGIDCSGFALRVLNASTDGAAVEYYKEALKLGKSYDVLNAGVSANNLTSLDYSNKITNLGDVSPGDFIRFDNGKHIGIIYKVDGNIIHYAHSSGGKGPHAATIAVSEAGKSGLDLKKYGTFDDWSESYSKTIKSLFNYICRAKFITDDRKKAK
jgi:lysozyme family protein